MNFANITVLYAGSLRKKHRIYFSRTKVAHCTCNTIIKLGKSVTVAGKSKQIDLMRNTDCRERPRLYRVIDIDCIFEKNVKNIFFYQRSSSNVPL